MTIAMSIPRKLALGFSLGPIILAVIGWIAYDSTARLLDAQEWYAHTIEVLDHIQTLRTDVLDAETGSRGFLLTNEDDYLAPYRASLANIDKEVSAIETLTADNPRQQARLGNLKPLIAARLAILADNVQFRRDKGIDAAAERVRSGGGKKMMDDIRAALDAVAGEERDLLQKRHEEAIRSAQFAFDSIIYGTVLTFILLAVVGWFVTRSITKPIGNALQMLTSSSAEILAGTSQQAAGTQQQAAAVAETVTTVDEIAQTSEQANERVRSVAEASRRAADVGAAGRKAVEDTVAVMGTVKEHAESIAQSILGLAEQAQAIGEIISAVNEIAEQTNLLALNAAIEASRAGEHGRGFTVVATEIKALAEQSKKATTEIRQILGDIQKATNGAVLATEQGAKSVNEALRTVHKAGATITTLADTIGESAQAASQITASVGQQAVGIGQIQQAMQSINQATMQNLASTQQAERAAQDLERLGGQLRTLLLGAGR